MLVQLFAVFAVLFFMLLGVSLFLYYLLSLISMIQSMIGGAPFVPLEYSVAERMLELVEPKKGEVVYDLGCGDSRQLMLASMRYGTKGVGVEIAWWPFLKSMVMRRMFGLQDEVKVYWKNIHDVSVQPADIVFLYLFESVLGKIKGKLQKELRPGTRIVSARYKFPDWEPKLVEQGEKHPIYVYVV
ncbi:MAG: hypothetical protein WCP97_09020 [bacterium]